MTQQPTSVSPKRSPWRLVELVVLVLAGAGAFYLGRITAPNAAGNGVASVPVDETVESGHGATSSDGPPPTAPYIVAAGRSPIPRPGETITTPIPAEKLTRPEPVTISTRPPPTGVVPWNEAHQYVGQTITIEGTVVNASKRPSICFLNFIRNWHGKFYVVVFPDLFDAWPASPEKHFLNKVIRVRGRVVLYRQRPQIQVRRKEQIELVNRP